MKSDAAESANDSSGSEESIGCRSSESNDSYLLLSGGFCGEDEFISEEVLNDIA